MWELVLLAVAATAMLAGGLAYGRCRHALAEADGAMSALANKSCGPRETFTEELLEDLPEIAQRYFRHAIRPGTPLATTVRLTMEGTFLLGDRDGGLQEYHMDARQVLAPPSAFVWMAVMRSGLMRISGSDVLVEGQAWTRFWMNGLIPAADARSSPDIVRSARARAAMEAIWVPASLLPSNEVKWEQTGPDMARLRFQTGIEPVDLTLDADGCVKRIVTMRWSDANPEKVFRLQPFGGTVESEARFDGFTIPSELMVGNHFGTDAYLPFFQARVRTAEYL